MNPEFATILCLFGFGISVALGWWSTVRVPLFQADLQLMIDELDATMKAGGTLDNAGYIRFRSHLQWTMMFAPNISIGQHLLAEWSIRRVGSVAVGVNPSVMAGLKGFANFQDDLEVVKQFKIRFTIHLIRFLMTGVADALILVTLMLLGRTKTLAAAFESLQIRDDGKLSPQAH